MHCQPSQDQGQDSRPETHCVKYQSHGLVRGPGAINRRFTFADQLNTKPFTTQNLYERATRAELAKDLDTAFRLYIEAGTAFLSLRRATPANPWAQEEARQGAARAVERAERIKAVKADLAPVWRDPFALGSSFYALDLKRCGSPMA